MTARAWTCRACADRLALEWAVDAALYAGKLGFCTVGQHRPGGELRYLEGATAAVIYTPPALRDRQQSPPAQLPLL